ncbi:MAG: hypothetical protein IRY99_12955 [Isosphaeraceae bacterium]|nr:hypothetical protein [Isosphaeraceae bacterium]
MRIYLLQLDHGPRLFYSDGPSHHDGDFDPASGGGVRAWLERQIAALHDALDRAEGGLGRHVKRVWHWLHRGTSLDESMLRGLRLAGRFTIYYPAAMSEAEARVAWIAYLAKRRRYHKLWMVLNALAVPPAILLAVLPGPNVFGLWFAYRALCHLAAWVGTRRARAAAKTATYVPLPALDEPIRLRDPAQANHLAGKLALSELDEYLHRVALAGPERVPVAPLTLDPLLNPELDSAPSQSDATAQLQHPQGDRRP